MGRRVAASLIVAASCGTLIVTLLSLETTLSFRSEVREMQRQAGALCDLGERSRWTPAPLERPRCAVQQGRQPLPPPPLLDPMFFTESSGPARDLARRVRDEDVGRWRHELARGATASPADGPLDVSAFQQVVCYEHDPSILAESRSGYERALVALLAHASRLAADDCLAESVVVMQLAQRLAHVLVASDYRAALGVTHLVARTVARCASAASTLAVQRAAQELDALARRPPPWVGASAWNDATYAYQRATVQAAIAEQPSRPLWPWSTTSEASAREWRRGQQALFRREADWVRLVCDVDSGAAPVDAMPLHAPVHTQRRSSACLRELAASLSAHSSLETRSAQAIFEMAPTCAATEDPSPGGSP